MSYEDAERIDRKLPSSTKAGMIAMVDRYIELENRSEVDSKDAGKAILAGPASYEWKEACGSYAASCFGILLRELLHEKRRWSMSNKNQHKLYFTSAEIARPVRANR